MLVLCPFKRRSGIQSQRCSKNGLLNIIMADLSGTSIGTENFKFPQVLCRKRGSIIDFFPWISEKGGLNFSLCLEKGGSIVYHEAYPSPSHEHTQPSPPTPIPPGQQTQWLCSIIIACPKVLRQHARRVGCLDNMWREFISQYKDFIFCPPYLWGKIDSQLLLQMQSLK